MNVAFANLALRCLAVAIPAFANVASANLALANLAVANLAQAITSPGDIILSPNPSYPIHPYGFIIAGASLRHLPAMDEGIFNPELYLSRLDQSIRESIPSPVALIVSFPSNPTAQVASLDFYYEIVKIAKKYNTYIFNNYYNIWCLFIFKHQK